MLAIVGYPLGFLFTLLAGYYVWYWYYYFTHRAVTDEGKPLPGPSPRFISGVDVREFKTHQLHKRLESYTRKYGPRFEMVILHQPSFVTTDADDLSQVLANKSFNMRMYPELFDRYLKKKGILFTNNLEHWKIQRAAALHGMMSNAHLNQVARWAEQVANKLVDNWLSTLHDNPLTDPSDGILVDIDEQLTRVALDVIGKAAFNMDINSVENDSSEIGKHFRNVMHATTAYFYIPPALFSLYTPPSLKEAEQSLETLRGFVREIMKLRRENEEGEKNNDLLEILLSYRGDDGKPLPDEDIIFTCWDMFIAGHETTAHTMAWALMFIAKNKEVQRKLQEEVDEVASLEEKRIEYLLPKLTYCQNVINETLRLIPTVPVFTRLSATTQRVGDYILKPWTPVVIFTPELHRNEKYWENGSAFQPQRWDNKDSLPLHCYKPFGSGARSCVGNRMAMIEAKAVLYKIILNFDVQYTINDCDIEETLNITMRPHGLKLHFTPRK